MNLCPIGYVNWSVLINWFFAKVKLLLKGVNEKIPDGQIYGGLKESIKPSEKTIQIHSN